MTVQEAELIEDHCKPLLDGYQSALDDLSASKTNDCLPYIQGQRRFYSNAISTLKQVISTAYQKAGMEYLA